MKKIFLLLLVNLSTYEWNEENILQQQKYQQDLIENNKDIAISHVVTKEIYMFFSKSYITFIVNKEFTEKYLSLIPTYNKIANNYLNNKSKIDEFNKYYCYKFYNFISTLKYLNSLVINFFVTYLMMCLSDAYSSVKKGDLVDISFGISYGIVNMAEFCFFMQKSITAAGHGIFLDDIDLTKSYISFSLKLVVGAANIYYYNNAFSKILIGVNTLIDIIGMFCIHKCRKKINLNQHKYIKINKKEYKDFILIRNTPLSVVLKNESGYTDCNNNFDEIVKGSKEYGYKVISCYDFINFKNI